MKRWSGPVSQYQSEAELGEIAKSLFALSKRVFGAPSRECLGHYFPEDF